MFSNKMVSTGIMMRGVDGTLYGVFFWGLEKIGSQDGVIKDYSLRDRHFRRCKKIWRPPSAEKSLKFSSFFQKSWKRVAEDFGELFERQCSKSPKGGGRKSLKFSSFFQKSWEKGRRRFWRTFWKTMFKNGWPGVPLRGPWYAYSSYE